MLFGKLLPRDGNFFEMFNAHGQAIVSGARAFQAMIQNYSDLTLREKYAAEVDGAEHAADKITAEVNRLLHKTFITPIDREQIHTLINSMDDILDLLQDTSETLSLYDVRSITEEVVRLPTSRPSAASVSRMRCRCCRSSPRAASPKPPSRPARRSTASSRTPTA